tara:strand:+ start:1378 stop:1767 length:390 start_codon:yes stop_codon:yes gene_type:complete
MATVSDALQELEITEWVLRGEPTTDAEFRQMFRKIIGTTDDNSAIESDNSADWPEGLTWDAVETKLNELNAAEPLKLLRAERDRLIALTDWWASSDLTMTAEQTTYRQALRDITEDYSSLDDVVWPTKP